MSLILAALLALVPQQTPAPAATATPAVTPVPATAAPAADEVRVRMTTAAGPIVLALDRGRAPITTANFLRYVDAKRLDGIDFFRAMRLEWGPGLIQAGQHQVAKLYPPIAHEPTTRTGLSHTEGAISMGRMKPGDARADFSIMVGDMTGLDAKPDQPGDNQGYAVFGRVVEGMDVVKAIWGGARDPNKGTGAMKGEMLATPVKILTVRRLP
jgi:peptidyl-prolyl cis-trans isomerase A (cyclophilin A)